LASTLDAALARLGIGFADLYRRTGLLKVDSAFRAFLDEQAPELVARLDSARRAPDSLAAKDEAALLLYIAPHLDRFIARLFGIEDDVAALSARHRELDPLFEVKRQFVQRRAATRIKADEAATLDAESLQSALEPLCGGALEGAAGELRFAEAVTRWLADELAHAEPLELATRYAAWAVHTAAGRERHGQGALFRTPAKVDPLHLLSHSHEGLRDGVREFTIDPAHIRPREGFALTDAGTDLAGALDQTNYCIWCHKQGKDSCSKGLREKPDPAAPQKVVFRKSGFGVPLAGCPLEERISEFHTAKSAGLAVAALALITIDNPMAAATGHRICNDCMKACIYQKQQPVDIPQAETRTLKDVLDLPWGFEIYSLLTRWNPLNVRRPLPREASGYRVLVVGMGPAGFTLAHHLMNDGHTVVGIDGLKIEPLAPSLGGVAADGSRVPFEPIHDIETLREPLGDRISAGFGGVAEYGITVRWDKNFLKVVRLLIERRETFGLFGGVRFGGTFDLDEALAPVSAGGLGFDHVALAMGAGKPTTLDIPNGLARGVRTASDFLMALQLTGAAKRDSIANMQIRLPAVVIGGGLTAIDTATESMAYYAVQIEKFLHRFESLAASGGEAALLASWSDEDRGIALEYIAHARELRAERAAAAAEARPVRLAALINQWGGVTVAYRRRLIDSPSYTLNHEEVEKALEEGIRFCEGLTPTAIETDAFGAARAIRFDRARFDEGGQSMPDGSVEFAARSIFIAAGTQPNTILAREDATHFTLDGKYFAACDEDGHRVKPQYSSSKPETADVLLTRHAGGRFVSFFGDLHPSFFGNVVKAMGSAKQGYPRVSRVLARSAPVETESDAAFLERLRSQLVATVHRVERLTPTIVEVVLHAPLAARHFKPGQFYRLQNFEATAPVIDSTRMQMEGLALTGAWVDPAQGLVSTIVLEMGGSANLCAMLQPGERVILMGPTGAPTHIESGETVALVGGGLGNAVLFSIGQAFRQQGSKVIYFAGYKKIIDRYKVDEIEQAADVIVWCCDEAPGFAPRRPQDLSFVGNIVRAIEAYASGALGPAPLSMADADRIIAIGSDRMMAAVAQARHTVLAPYLKKKHHALGSINSPMQCMMKEICAQCLQAHRDPVTGEIRYVFSCYNQDQDLDRVDFASLNQRLAQNGLQERLTARWIADRMPELRRIREMV
jgi:NADPH-dependent glutamate synthase beta subunit-like oxidoreductase/NAD(P)H-flavin reductase